MPNPTISVILVNWNTRDLLLQCIRSIKSDCEGIETEIIVSDNASMDGSADAVLKEFPEIKVLKNQENLGFAKGNNVAIRQSRGDFICLVNTDVEIIKGCFPGLLRYMRDNPSAGITGPQALNADQQVQITARKDVGFLNSFARIFWIDILFPSLTWYSQRKLEEVDALAGCFWMIRREALEQIGLLDEDFFFYGEDRDYCKRMRLAGWKVIFNPDFKIFHYEAGSSKARPFHYYMQLERAFLQYWKKYHGKSSTLVYYLFRIVYHLVRYTTNMGANVLSLKMNTERKSKALRSWYCIRMLTGFEKKVDMSFQTENSIV